MNMQEVVTNPIYALVYPSGNELGRQFVEIIGKIGQNIDIEIS